MKLLNKIKISLIFAFFIVILFNLKSFAVTGVITEITVNMRKEPSTNSKKIMYVTQDYKVEVLEKVGEWYKIKYKGITGYVFGEYVDVDDTKLTNKEQKVEENNKEEIANKNEQKQEETMQEVTTTGDLKLKVKKGTDIRLIPNITSNIVYTVKDEMLVDVIENLDVWAYILVDNTYGWSRIENIVEENINPKENNSKIKEEESKKEITNKEETNEEIKKEEKIAYIKYNTVNLRQKSSTSAKVLSKLKLNQQVTVLEKVNNLWSKVKVDGKIGYVSTDLLADEKQKETKKEENITTSRDGETTSRNDKQSEETIDSRIESNIKEESDNKEMSSNSNTNKEETTSSSTIQKGEITTSKKDEQTTASKTKGEEIVEYAKRYLGYKYVLGGASPKTGFDCSGLTSYIYKQFGYKLSRTSTAQAKNGREVSKNNLQPGDLLIFKNQELTKIGHVGIYIGNNKMIHASEPGVGVVITDLDARGYNYNKRFVTARRIID